MRDSHTLYEGAVRAAACRVLHIYFGAIEHSIGCGLFSTTGLQSVNTDLLTSFPCVVCKIEGWDSEEVGAVGRLLSLNSSVIPRNVPSNPGAAKTWSLGGVSRRLAEERGNCPICLWHQEATPASQPYNQGDKDRNDS